MNRRGAREKRRTSEGKRMVETLTSSYSWISVNLPTGHDDASAPSCQPRARSYSRYFDVTEGEPSRLSHERRGADMQRSILKRLNH